MAQRHMDRLTSFDTSFLANEKSNGHMAIGAVLVCEGEPPSHEEFLAQHPQPPAPAAAPAPAPRLSRRWGSARPFWVDHPEFDVHEHVAASTLAAPGSDEQFRDRRRRDLRAAARPLAAALGAAAWSRASRTTASRSSTRPTTRWPTASPRSTSASCSSTSSRPPSRCRSRRPGSRSGRPRGSAWSGTPCAGSGRCSCRAGRWLRRRLPQARAAPPNAPPTASPASGRSPGT